MRKEREQQNGEEKVCEPFYMWLAVDCGVEINLPG